MSTILLSFVNRMPCTHTLMTFFLSMHLLSIELESPLPRPAAALASTMVVARSMLQAVHCVCVCMIDIRCARCAWPLIS